ncbi:MAG: hypothetical protein R3E95_09030 [Thiolinea sp.]
MTLEMPFKDNQARPEPLQGWSPRRSQQLGASLLEPIARYFCWLSRLAASGAVILNCSSLRA